jgi:hypothetical protein
MRCNLDHEDPNQRRIQQEARRRMKEQGIKYTQALRQVLKEIEAKHDTEV